MQPLRLYRTQASHVHDMRTSMVQRWVHAAHAVYAAQLPVIATAQGPRGLGSACNASKISEG